MHSTNELIKWRPFQELQLRFGNRCLLKENWRPPNWFVVDAGTRIGPFGFQEAVAHVLNKKEDVILYDIVNRLGIFESEKDAYRLALQQITTGFDITPRTPQGITISPGNYCSAGCSYCYAKPRFKSQPSPQTSEAVLRNTLDFLRLRFDASEACALTIGGGGDPIENFGFYRKALELADLYRDKYGLNVSIYISTLEPSFLCEEHIELIARHQDWITLSIDGDPIVRNHRPFANVEQLMNRYRSHCKWAASAVFTARTASRISDSYTYLLKAGFDAIQMRPARLLDSHPLSLKKQHYEVAAYQYKEFINNLNQEGLLHFIDRLSSADYFGRYFYRYLTEQDVLNRCGAGIGTVFVTPLGDIAPCPSTVHSLLSLGNVNTNNFDNTSINNLHAKPDVCKSCRIFNVCGGPCGHESLLHGNELSHVESIICDFQKDLCDLAVSVINKLYLEDARVLIMALRSYIRRTGNENNKNGYNE